VTLCYPLSYGLSVAPSKEDGEALEKGMAIGVPEITGENPVCPANNET
jgi:hypothetical protein